MIKCLTDKGTTENTQCGIYLVARISTLTKSAKQISGANVTDLLKSCCSVPDNAMPLSFKNRNAHNQSFEMHTFWEIWRNLPKTEVRNHMDWNGFVTLAIDIRLTFFVNFDTLLYLVLRLLDFNWTCFPFWSLWSQYRPFSDLSIPNNFSTLAKGKGTFDKWSCS